MAYKIIWLDEARQSLDAEMEYVYAEFGQLTLAKVYDDLMLNGFRIKIGGNVKY